MTDYSLQGKTRPYNPMHLDYCKSHQTCYTALSRTATAKGTILLQLISPSKVQGSTYGSLCQEFRELELLDKITRLCYEHCLPITVKGECRYMLIDSYCKVEGEYYVHSFIHLAILWSKALPFKPNQTEDIPWHILKKEKLRKGEKAKMEPTASTANKDISIVSHIIPAMNGNKCKGQTSDNYVPLVTCNHKKGHIVSCSMLPLLDASANPYGCRWVNNSCAFDVFLAMFFNIWCSDSKRFKSVFQSINPSHLGIL